MKKTILTVAAALTLAGCGGKQTSATAADSTNAAPTPRVARATVYYIDSVSPENLVKIYQALGREATGRVAVKISTGEAGNTHYLQPSLIKPLVDAVHGTIVECNTNYGGSRMHSADHWKTIRDHGFLDIARVDIMDDSGEVSLPVPAGSKNLKEDIVGKDLLNYDFLVVLNHFKGHAMGGFGGALKNLSIGCASCNGKGLIHTAGRKQLPDWSRMDDPSIAGMDQFKDCMAEAAGAVVNHFGDKILYISVMNNLSVDCDCDGHPSPAKMKDMGIVASLDPVALDQACVDMVMNSDDPGNRDLVERIVSRHGTRILYWAQHLGYGTRDYDLVHLK